MTADEISFQARLWLAISEVVEASGGDNSCTSVARQKAVAKTNRIVEERIASKRHVGQGGLRDADAPCSMYTPGKPEKGGCDGDGHYLCRECKLLAEKGDE